MENPSSSHLSYHPKKPSGRPPSSHTGRSPWSSACRSIHNLAKAKASNNQEEPECAAVGTYVQSAGNIQNDLGILTLIDVLVAPNVFLGTRIVPLGRVEPLRPAKSLTELFENGDVLRVAPVQGEKTIEWPSPSVAYLHDKVPVLSWQVHSESPLELSHLNIRQSRTQPPAPRGGPPIPLILLNTRRVCLSHNPPTRFSSPPSAPPPQPSARPPFLSPPLYQVPALFFYHKLGAPPAGGRVAIFLHPRNISGPPQTP